MKSLAFLCVAVLGVLCLVSCNNEGTPVNPSQDIELEQVVIASPPVQSGPYVIRYEEGTWVWIWDVENSMYAIIGFDVWDYCSGELEFDIVSIQDVMERPIQNAINEILHGDHMTVSVWPVGSVDCDVLMNIEPIATGYVDITSTDNDYFAYLQADPKRMNAFGTMGHGVVETYGGGTAQLSFHWRQCWRLGEGVYQYHEQITLGTKGPKH